MLILPLITVLALLMSAPIFLHTDLSVPHWASSGDGNPWSHLVFCVEDWNYRGDDGIRGGQQKHSLA